MKRFHSNNAQRSIKSKRSMLHLFHCLHLNVYLLFLILFHATIFQSVFVDSFQLKVVLHRTFRNANFISLTTKTTLPFTVKNDNSYSGRNSNNKSNDLIRLYSTPKNNNNNDEDLLSLPKKETKDNNNNTKTNQKKKSTSTQRKQKIPSNTILNVRKLNTATDLTQKQTRRTWEDSYKLLKRYKEEHGDCLVPAKYEKDKKLGIWVHKQRQQAKIGKLKLERKNELDEIGFSWDVKTDNWNFMLEQLKEFQEEFGHSNVERDKYKSRQTLALWVITQRKFKYLLTNDQQSQLDEIGFVWEDVKKARGDRQWEERFEALQEYQRIHGDTRVPISASHNNINLGKWVFTQRQNYRKGILRKDREDRLNSIGFIWRLKDHNPTDYEKINKIWMNNFEKLKDFKMIHNHTNVPYRYEADPKLGKWVFTQRSHYRLGILKKSRQEMLESIGFEWNPREQAYGELWMDHYKDLVVFQNKYGHINIPTRSHKILYEWLLCQRMYFANNKLDSDRKELLEKLGVDLNVGPGSGNIMEE